MSKAFGYKKTKDLDAKETIKFYKKKLGDEQKAKDRAKELGKDLKFEKNASKKIKNKKDFVTRGIIKEKDVNDISEDKLLHKKEYSNILKKNVRALKNMADKQGISIDDLISLLKDE